MRPVIYDKDERSRSSMKVVDYQTQSVSVLCNLFFKRNILPNRQRTKQPKKQNHIRSTVVSSLGGPGNTSAVAASHLAMGTTSPWAGGQNNFHCRFHRRASSHSRSPKSPLEREPKTSLKSYVRDQRGPQYPAVQKRENVNFFPGPGQPASLPA